GGDENDPRRRIVGQNVATSSRAVQLRHPVIHQDKVGFVERVAVDRFQAGTDYGDDFVSAPTDHARESGAEATLVVSDENAHRASEDSTNCAQRERSSSEDAGQTEISSNRISTLLLR